MNTNSLARLYEKLTPRERLPLIVAAEARGDDAEACRLVRTAPRASYRLPDYHGLGECMAQLSLIHLLTLLDLAAEWWQVSGWHAEDHLLPGKEAKARKARFWGLMQLAAYALVVHADGWTQFCAELKIDGDAPLKHLPGYGMVQETLELARGMAFAREQAVEWMPERRGKAASTGAAADPQVVTCDGVARSLRAFLDDGLAWWG